MDQTVPSRSSCNAVICSNSSCQAGSFRSVPSFLRSWPCPATAIAIFHERSDPLSCSPPVESNEEGSPPDPEQTIFGAYPDPAPFARCNGADVSMCQGRHQIQRNKMPVLVSRHAGSCAYPEPPGGIEAQYGDMLVGNRRFILAIENDEADTVESGKAFLGADPQVPVRRTGHRLDGTLRQALRNLPVNEGMRLISGTGRGTSRIATKVSSIAPNNPALVDSQASASLSNNLPSRVNF